MLQESAGTNATRSDARDDAMPVAIVGIGCRFPGGIDSPSAFWRALEEGLDAIGDVPLDRMDVEALYDPRPATPGRIVSRRGGYLPAIDTFDAGFFGISPRQAERLDPQHRLLLETSWEAMEDAGLDVASLAGTAVGVFVGQWQSDFERRLFADAEGVDFRMTTGSGRYASAGRVSYTFGFNGPSLTIDTACSSSLAAVIVACRSLRAGESTMALAGGVNVILEPHITIAYSQSRMMAADGRCKFGDAKADGYVRSEGCGMLVLRPLADAIAAGDRIYAVIRGGALNNDGRGVGSFGTPSRAGQRALLRRAYADAGIAPERVRYVEAHGAGTPAGDPVELDALHAELGAGRDASRKLLVGSVKTNIGHTEGAAGAAGIIKVALALQHGVIPRSLHLETPNPSIPWDSLAVEIPQENRAWPPGDGPRVAGVSGFGIAGSNGHVVLEEAPPPRARVPEPSATRAYALPLSAQSFTALAEMAGAYASLLESANAPSLRDVCLSAALLRTPLRHRAVFVAEDSSSLIERLRRFAAGDAEAANAVAEAPETPGGQIAFVFAGQGAQWSGMTRELLEREPVFAEAIDACERAMAPYVDWSLREQLMLDAGAPGSRMDDISVIQPVLLAVEIAFAALWRSWGIEPRAVVGHSMGEVGAAYVAGVLSLEDAMRVICHRSRLLRRTSGQGAMGIVGAPPSDVEERIARVAGRLSVAVLNAPRSTVVSGDPAALDELLASLEADGIFARRVKVDVASHSAQMDPLVPELVERVAAIRPRVSPIGMYSTVDGVRIEGTALDARYWGRNLREPVRFSDAVRTMVADGIDTFVELSPHPLLTSAIVETAHTDERSVKAVGSTRREEPEQAAMLAAIGTLWANGVAVDWARAMPGEWNRVSLPRYPWQRQRYWHPAAELVPLRGGSARQTRTARPSDDLLASLYTMAWEDAPLPAESPSNPGEWLVVSDDADERARLAEALGALGATATTASHDGGLSSRAANVVWFAVDSEDAPFEPLRVLQAQQSSGPLPKLWFVTRGGQSVNARERVSPWLGALWGAARVVAEEHPEAWNGLVDLPTDAFDASLLARALLARDGEDQIALRGSSRLALRLVALPRAGSDTSPSWRADAAYLVTGGLGDIALNVASAMVDAGARRLVLLGRTPLPPRTEWASVDPASTAGRRIAAIRALEAKGAAIHLLTADVGDADTLASALEAYAREAWPPIRGVVHAAGLLDNRLAATMDRATFERALSPKLRGAVNLDRLLPDVELFIMFSSTGGFVPQAGQANYAAANAGLDALAYDRRARGLHASSIAWGVWADTGLVKNDAGARNTEEMARQGIGAFTVDDGIRVFEWLRRRSEAMVSVLPANWQTFKRARAGRSLSLFAHQLDGVGDTGGGSSDAAARLRDARSPSERRQIIDGVVRELAARVLRLPAARLDARRPLGSVGLDSLMALELRNRLEAALERSLPATLLWNYPTLEALGAFLAESSAPVRAPATTTVSSDRDPAVAIAVGEVAQMSDDDAAQALRGSRRRARPRE